MKNLLIYSLLLLPSCKHFQDVSPRDAFASYRVAVYDLGKTLETYKRRTETTVIADYDALTVDCKAGDKACETEAKKIVVAKYKSRQDAFNKVQEFHKKCVDTSHVVDTLCAPGDSEVCEKSVEEALKSLPEIITKIREMQLWRTCTNGDNSSNYIPCRVG